LKTGNHKKWSSDGLKIKQNNVMQSIGKLKKEIYNGKDEIRIDKRAISKIILG